MTSKTFLKQLKDQENESINVIQVPGISLLDLHVDATPAHGYLMHMHGIKFSSGYKYGNYLFPEIACWGVVFKWLFLNLKNDNTWLKICPYAYFSIVL